MELVAMDLKLRGMYIARQLSFQGVSFRIEEIPIETQFKNVYNSAVKLVSGGTGDRPRRRPAPPDPNWSMSNTTLTSLLDIVPMVT